MKNILTIIVIGSFFALAWAADNSCDVHEPCLDGTLDGINGNGTRCPQYGIRGVVNTVGPVNSTEYHCVTYSSKCTPKSAKCNKQEKWYAEWYDVVCEDSGSDIPSRTHLRWCLSRVLQKSSTNLNCSGKKCLGVAVLPANPAYPYPL